MSPDIACNIKKRDILVIWPERCICGVVYSQCVTLHLLVKTQQCHVERSLRLFAYYQHHNTQCSIKTIFSDRENTDIAMLAYTKCNAPLQIYAEPWSSKFKFQFFNSLTPSFQFPMKSQLCMLQAIGVHLIVLCLYFIALNLYLDLNNLAFCHKHWFQCFFDS